jgi:UDP-N-acetylglucosamine 2-epimerase
VKVLSVVGNRPQFVKSAPLSVAFLITGIDEVIVHTGQHYDRELSDVFIKQLGLPEPRHMLELHTADPDVMTPAIEAVIRQESPDLVLVYGDTNSTLAGARASARASIPLAHVEAGLRSGDMSMPEEHARIEVDRLAWLLFCPNDRARATLAGEGVLGQTHVVGDVMAEASARFAPIARERFPIPFEPHTYVIATVHRQANVFQPRLGRIVEGLNRIDERVVFPAHPRTRAQIKAERIELEDHVRMTDPLSYLELASLASQARVIATDSGGLQKEAYWYGVPCVTLRPSTEWVDTVEVGANVLVDDDPDAIVAAVQRATMPERRPQLYGDGRASARIAGVLHATMPGR